MNKLVIEMWPDHLRTTGIKLPWPMTHGESISYAGIMAVGCFAGIALIGTGISALFGPTVWGFVSCVGWIAAFYGWIAPALMRTLLKADVEARSAEFERQYDDQP